MRPLPVLALIAAGIVPAFAADSTPLALTVAPAQVSLVQDFASDDDKADANDKEALVRRMYRVQWGRQEPGCQVGVRVSGPKGWKPVSVKPGVLIDAKTETGESLSAMSKNPALNFSVTYGGDHSRVIYGREYQGHDDKEGELVTFQMACPTQSAARISALSGSVDLVYGNDESMKHFDFVPVEGETKAVTGIEGCDLSFSLSEGGQITVDYSPKALDLVKSVDYLDADGKSCQAMGISSSSGLNSKMAVKLNFGQRVPATIAVDCYTALKAVRATFALKDIPLVGAASAEVRKPRPATVQEIVLPEAQDAAQGKVQIQLQPAAKNDF